MIFPLRQCLTTLLCITRRRVRATFLRWWWWLQSALIVVRVRIVDSRPRTLLPKFGADSRCIQHPRGGLGDAFGTDARTDASAGWGEICASRPMRELGNRIGSVLTFHSSVARVQSVLRVCEASFSTPSLNSRLVKPEGTVAGGWRAIGSTTVVFSAIKFFLSIYYIIT